MRRIALVISIVVAAPAFAQYGGYGYNQPYAQPQYQQPYPPQQPYYAPPAYPAQAYPQNYQQPQTYQQPTYQQPAYPQQTTAYDQQYAQQYYGQQGHQQQPYQQTGYGQNYGQAMAQSQLNPAAGLVNTDYFTVNVGANGILDSRQDYLYGLEYRYKDVYYGLRPTLGYQGDTRGAAYGYAGIAWDLPLGIEPIIITPMTAIGAYAKGNGVDLGHAIEFRSAIEMAYQRESGTRLGLLFGHMSNASIGDKNPGTEILQVTYQHPLGLLD